MNDEHDDQARPFGGWMYTSVVDPETGRLVSVPDKSRPYFSDETRRALADGTVADAAPVAASPAPANASAAKESRSRFGVWVVWRRTDAEEGTAPRWVDLDAARRHQWFDDLAVTAPDDCERAWGGICSWIERTFPGCHALRTPAETACVLIEHTLPWGKGQPKPFRYPTLPDGLRKLIAATTTQHRMEQIAPEGTLMRRYVAYDARVAFGGYLRHLPVVPADGVQHDAVDVYEPYRAGKYRVELMVPADWGRVGIAPRRLADELSWEWPSQPGETWETWLDESEMRLVVKCGWPYTVRERLLFAPQKTPGEDPLREYATRMCAELERIERYPTSVALRAYRAALRALTIHPVGAWHKGSGTDSRHVDSLDELTPDDALADILRDDETGGYTVTNTVELTPFRSRWWRPEWSSAVYARERMAVTRRALEIPREHLIALRGDALHLADFDPEWEDTGKVGGYRKQHDATFRAPRTVPTTGRALVELGQEVGG